MFRFRRLAVPLVLIATIFVVAYNARRVVPKSSHIASLEAQFRGFQKLPMDEKCARYFHGLQRKNPHWRLVPRDKYSAVSDIAADLDHLRVYLRCYLSSAQLLPDSEAASESTPLVYLASNVRHLLRAAETPSDLDAHALHKKVFPYLTNKLPVFTRWSGERFYDVPDFGSFDNSVGEMPTTKDQFAAMGTFEHAKSQWNLETVQHLHAAAMGRGIVVTCSNKHVASLRGLLRVLRSLNNTLPLQVVFHSDLSSKKIGQIVRAARDEGPGPKQDLWFVNTQGCVEMGDRALSGLSKSFGNKLSAALFTTFEEFLLLDADTVPLVAPETVFQMTQYSKTGTVFFQDRTDLRFNTPRQTSLVKQLLPKDLESFGIEATRAQVLQNRFFQHNAYYFQEAGLVAMNRKQHFAGLLAAAHLHTLLGPALEDKLWGDKELYWLGLSVAGDDNYAFNKYGAAAVGQLTNNTRHLLFQNTTELCSTHPGQISDNDAQTLLWINSGFQTCKDFKSISWDNTQERYKGMRRYKLRELYKSPLHIEAALVPPEAWTELAPPFDHASKGWQQTQYCYSYLWCAFKHVGQQQGHLVEFGPEDVAKYEMLGRAWTEELKLN